MADKRMLSRAIVESDAFLELPFGAQALYLHLCLAADDEGFVGSPKRVIRSVNAKAKDFKALENARFVLTFESGVCVIKHWCMMNKIRPDREKRTTYIDERMQLTFKTSMAYTWASKCPADSSQAEAERQTADGQSAEE